MPTYFIQLLKYMLAFNIAETVTDQITKSDYFRGLAIGSPSENMRGGFFRAAASIDGQNKQIEAIEDYSLISVRG